MRRLALLAVCIVMLIVGCSTGHGAGQLAGDLSYDGPLRPTPGLLRTGSIEVRLEGQTVTTAQFGDGHGFTLKLKTGTYEVVGHSGDASCSPKTVSVVRGKTATVHIICRVR